MPNTIIDSRRRVTRPGDRVDNETVINRVKNYDGDVTEAECMKSIRMPYYTQRSNQQAS